MKPALSFRQPHYPSSWGKLPNGDIILNEINLQLAPWWPKFFGYHLLKIGALSGAVDSTNCAIKHQMTLCDNKNALDSKLSTQKRSCTIHGEVDDLPFLEHSVDVCLLSHALEFSLDPHHVIREANRVLIPNGYLVVTGYNPFSLVGINKLIPYRRQHSPWNERFFSAMRVKDWLHLMGYEILMDERGLHSTLANNMSYGIVARNWRRLADNYFSSLGSIYTIVAKKRVLPLTPIKPKWQLRAKLEPIKVSSVNSSQ